MKTHWDISDILYPIVNVASITGLIDGEVYRDKKKVNSELQDIEFKMPPLKYSSDRDIQSTLVHILIYCKNYDNGLPNETKLNAITKAVIAVIEAYKPTGGTYHDFELIDETLHPDVNQIKMSYIDIRMQTAIEQIT